MGRRAVVAPPPPPVTLDLDALLGVFEGQAERMEKAFETPPLSTPERAAVEVVRPTEPPTAEPAPDERGTSRQPPSDWVTVLDKGLARVLVERGRTPFDPHVAVHVTTAGDQLRRMESEYREDEAANLALKRDDAITSRQYNDLMTQARQQHRAARTTTLEWLASELDALILAEANGSSD